VGKYKPGFRAPLYPKRPRLQNPDGTYSTESTITVESDGLHYVLPTVIEGKRHDNPEAIQMWQQGSNEPVGVFGDANLADRYAQERHQQTEATIAVQDMIQKMRAYYARLQNTWRRK
jgi:cell division septum initiation protein DivIVA